MEQKEVIDSRLAEMSEEIGDIKNETIWIRNKILGLCQTPYNLYAQYQNK